MIRLLPTPDGFGWAGPRSDCVTKSGVCALADDAPTSRPQDSGGYRGGSRAESRDKARDVPETWALRSTREMFQKGSRRSPPGS